MRRDTKYSQRPPHIFYDPVIESNNIANFLLNEYLPSYIFCRQATNYIPVCNLG